jgi:hypothetical protein
LHVLNLANTGTSFGINFDQFTDEHRNPISDNDQIVLNIEATLIEPKTRGKPLTGAELRSRFSCTATSSQVGTSTDNIQESNPISGANPLRGSFLPGGENAFVAFYWCYIGEL